MPIRGLQQSPDSIFPYGNKFIYAPSNHGTVFGRTWGTGSNFSFSTEAEGNSSPTTVDGMYYLSDAGNMKLNAIATNNDYLQGYAATTKLHGFGRSNSTEGSGNGLRITSFDEVVMNAPGGTKPSTDRTCSAGGCSDLGASKNGTMIYCTNCQKTTPCSSGGSGAIAKRLNGAWDCN